MHALPKKVWAVVLIGGFFVISACKSAGTHTTGSQAKDLELGESYTYYVPPHIWSSCENDIIRTFQEFPVLSNISLKKTENESSADIKFVDQHELDPYDFRFEDNGSFKIGVRTNLCIKRSGENNPLYPGISMAMRLIKEQKNLRFAGACGKSYYSLDSVKGSPDASKAPKVNYYQEGSIYSIKDSGLAIKSAFGSINRANFISLQRTGSEDSASLVMKFEDLGSSSPISEAELVTTSGKAKVYSTINTHLLSSFGSLWDRVRHEAYWQLYLLETSMCQRFAVRTEDLF